MSNSQGAAKARYDKAFNARPAEKKRRAARNTARRRMIAKRGKAALRGKDVDHKDFNPRNNSSKNLRVISTSKNRSRGNNRKRRKK